MLIIKRAPIFNEDKTRVYQNSCTIQALSNALNISYDLSLLLLQRVKPTADGYVITKKPMPKSQFSNTVHYVNFLSLFANKSNHKLVSYYGFSTYGVPTRRIARELKGTHILLEKGHAKVLHNGHIVDTQDSLNKEVHQSFRIYKSKYMPFLIDVCEQLGVNYEDHMQKQPLSTYIRKFDMDEYYANIAKERAKLQDKDTFVELAKEIGLNPKFYGKEVEIDGSTYKITEIKKRNRKYPIIARSENDHKGYKLSIDDVYLLTQF